LLGSRFAGKAKAVYEFETMYNHTAHLYPAMAALFRALGAQIAHMWTYSLTPTAEFLSGSHHLNLYCTPRKAVSFAAAAELFSRVPRHTPYSPADEDDLVFGPAAVSFRRDLALFCSETVFMHSGPVSEWCPLPLRTDRVSTVFGVGSSPLLGYDGTGAYSMSVGRDAIDLLINPDAEFIRPPWDRQTGPSWERVCRLTDDRPHRIEVRVPGWDTIRVERVDGAEAIAVPAEPGKPAFRGTPGHYRIHRARD
jgi:hypothetical protein